MCKWGMKQGDFGGLPGSCLSYIVSWRLVKMGHYIHMGCMRTQMRELMLCPRERAHDGMHSQPGAQSWAWPHAVAGGKKQPRPCLGKGRGGRRGVRGQGRPRSLLGPRGQGQEAQSVVGGSVEPPHGVVSQAGSALGLAAAGIPGVPGPLCEAAPVGRQLCCSGPY